MNEPLKGYSLEEVARLASQTCADEAEGTNEKGYFALVREACRLRARELGAEEIIDSIFTAHINAADGAKGLLKTLPEFFMTDSRGNDTVNCARLASYVAEREQFVFANTAADERPVIYHYEDGVYVKVNENTVKRLILKYVRAYRPDLVKSLIAAEVLSLLYSLSEEKDIATLTCDENIVNFRNGLLHLDTMELTPHTPDIFTTVQLKANWSEEDIPTPVFDSFMKELSGGEADNDTLLREYMGACMSNVPGYKFKKALFQTGPGNTGKTVLQNLTKSILGKDNCAAVTFSALENDRFATSRMYMKRLAGCSDLSVLPLKDISVFKMLTGGDEIAAEFKGRAQFSFVYKGFLWFCMNKLPKFGGDNGKWVFERMMILPCRNVIPPEKRDIALHEKLIAETDGIVRRCLFAFKAAIDRGYVFTEPLDVMAQCNEAMTENDSLRRWYVQCCTLRDPESLPDDKYTVSFMYHRYKAWCLDNNEALPVSRSDFKSGMAEMFYRTEEEIMRRTNKGRYYIFTLNDDSKLEYQRGNLKL